MWYFKQILTKILTIHPKDFWRKIIKKAFSFADRIRDKQFNSRASCPGFKLATFGTRAVWTLGSRHLHAGVICHFALIVSLRPGRNVSIKIMSIEKSFLVFTFKLQHAFTGSAVFHVKWSVLMQTRSLGIQRGYTLVTEGLCWGGEKKKWGRERDGWEGRKGSVDWKTVISSFQRDTRATELFQQGLSRLEVQSRRSQRCRELPPSCSPLLLFHPSLRLSHHPATLSLPLQKEINMAVQSAARPTGECRLTVEARCGA